MVKRLTNIDVLKALAIASVVVLHSVSRETLESTAAVFHIWQAVPVFLVLLGVAATHGKPRPYAHYLANRAQRLAPAFAIVWVVSLAIGLTLDKVYLGPLLAIGQLPYSGPGNYYITLLLQFVLVMPFLMAAYRRAPKITLISAAAVSLAFELVAFSAGWNGYLYSAASPRYLLAVVLGMWVASGRSATLGLILAIPYLAAHALYGYRIPWFVDVWQPQNLIAFSYAAVLVQMGLHFLPRSGKGPVVQVLSTVGRASYHVFLVQMLWFSVARQFLPVRHPAFPALSLVVCLAAGVVFWWAEGRATDMLRGAR